MNRYLINSMHSAQCPNVALYTMLTHAQVRKDVLDTIQNLLNAKKDVLATSEQKSQSTSR